MAWDQKSPSYRITKGDHGRALLSPIVRQTHDLTSGSREREVMGRSRVIAGKKIRSRPAHDELAMAPLRPTEDMTGLPLAVVRRDSIA